MKRTINLFNTQFRYQLVFFIHIYGCIWLHMWRCAEHPVLWVYRGHGSLILWLFLDNIWWARFGCTTSEVRHLIFRCYIIKEHCDVICDVTALHMLSHVTFYYKRCAEPWWRVLACCSSVRQVQLYHQKLVAGA